MKNSMPRGLFVIACACVLTAFGCSGGDASVSTTATDASAEAPRAPFDPTVARIPIASKSLTMAPDWQPPSPTRTQPAQMRPRVVPSRQYGVATHALSPAASDAEITASGMFREPLRPVIGVSSAEETKALVEALAGPSPKDERGVDALERFVAAHPSSRWAPSLHLNMGAIAYRTGYFQDALSHYKEAWELAKAGEDPASTDIANQGLAEYARMNARVGRMTELEPLLKEAEKRTLMGDARVKITGAAEGLWSMQHRPGAAFRCGPFALMSVAEVGNRDVAKKAAKLVETVESPTTGFSLAEVHRMSKQVGLDLQMAKREPGAAVIVPAVVHWKVGHFGALVREQGGSYLLKDPTFGNETWITQRALDAEASGYFLVPTGGLASGWSRAAPSDAAKVYGKGAIDNIGGGTGDGDGAAGGGSSGGGAGGPTGGSGGSCGGGGGGGGGPGGSGGPGGTGGPSAPWPFGLPMATYRLHILAASLHIEDTPVGYSAALGPDVRVRLAYNQREEGQPASIDFTSFGPQFVSNWVSYLIDNTFGPSTNITLRMRGGGSETHTSFNATTQSFGNELKTSSMLQRLTANTYKKVYPDGREEYYEQYLGTSGSERRVFLSRVVDAHGKEVSIQYDATYPARIDQIVDATGLATVFHYVYPGQPYLVTSIEDPFGRAATFAYAPSAGQVRLQSTEDPYGIVSSFEYSAAGEIVAMTTPYGRTTFDLSTPYLTTSLGLFRFIEATDPLGQTERIEFNVSNTLPGVGSTLETPWPSATAVNFTTSYNFFRNSFYWDKLAMKLAPGDYTKAHRYHWLHFTGNSAGPILESELPPLEGRVFYNYLGQTDPIFLGPSALPTVIARVVQDETGTNQTQATKYEYNAQGNVTHRTDPMGRETRMTYATNGVDVLTVEHKTGTSGGSPVWTTISSSAYAPGMPPHRASSVTDGAGQTTSFTYAADGQVATTQNVKSEVTTYAYETSTSSPAFGRLLSITGDVPGGNRTFTYDSVGRLATTTDSEGYTLAYAYDTLDRVRTVTYPDGSFEQMEYEDHSLVASRDREGRWTRHMYNGLTQRVLTQDPALRTTQFQWCRCGKLRRFVDGNGNLTEWVRDEAGRETRKNNADGSYELYAYDLSGRLHVATDAMSQTQTYAYTVDDRIAKKDYSDTATADVTYAYDAYFPRVASRQDGIGTTTYAYHPYGTSTLGAGQLSLENGPLSDDTLKRTYDELGRLKKLEVVDDATHTTATYSEDSSFDARARVSAVQNNLGTSSYAFVGQSSRVSTATYPNGMQVLYDYYTATGDFLLKQIKNLSAGPTTTVISQFDYTYRPDRAIDTWTVNQGTGATTWTFGYDASRQLTGATKRNASMTVLEADAYAYDKAGNRVQVGDGTTAPRNYDVNALNQLLSERDFGTTTFSGYVDEPAKVTVNGKPATVTSTDGGAPFKFDAVVDLDAGANTVSVEARDGHNNVSTKSYSVTTTGTNKHFEYDVNGNLRFEKDGSGTVLKEYRWDQQNRLVKALLGTHESDYFYDGESRRVRIKELESGTQTKDETFVWCGLRICQKRSGSTVERNYFEQGFEEGTTDFFYTRDHLGSIREVVGSDGTTVASRASYDPWGKSTGTGSGAQSDFGFTGHYFDRPTGLALTWYRAYDSNSARWLSEDPLGLQGGTNLYGYVENTPIDQVDPDGLSPTIVGFNPNPGGLLCTLFGLLCAPPAPPQVCPYLASQPRQPCPPCPPPPPPRVDVVPPSRPHYPCPGSHMHTYVYNQNPVTCQCFVNPGPVICL